MGMTAIKTGDTVTIRRGKRKGESGTVVSGNQCVVEFTDGTLSLLNETDLKAPDEATIGATALADAIGEVARHNPGDDELLMELANRLGKFLPDFSAASVAWPVAAGDDPSPDLVA